MSILGLGYIGIGASDIGAWRSFAADILGVAVSDAEGGGLRLRVDSRDWRIAVQPDPADDILYAGWETTGPEEMAASIAKIEAAGVNVSHDDGALASKRGVLGIATFTDPAGMACELFWGATERRHEPFVSPAGVSGFMTGDEGLGHIVIGTNELVAVERFYFDVLGFRLSDRIFFEVAPQIVIPVTFTHCNPRHHSFAFAPAAPGSNKKLLHFMLQTAALDDVGRALDRCARNGVSLGMTLGRHSNDHMVSFYAHTPSGFEVEYGWGAPAIDEEIWTVTRHDRISIWGHHRPAPPGPGPG